MARIKVGFQIHPQQCSFAEYPEVWTRLDQMGADSLWDWDHFFPLYGNKQGNLFEGWTTLAFLSSLTRNATVGCLVLSMSYRNPSLLAAMSRTLDHATDGRAILGLGAGWFQKDYQEYGYEFGTPASRLKNLERGIKIIKERWQKDSPAPLRGTVPIMIGGGGEKVTLRLVAQHAALWNSFGPPEKWARKNQVLDQWCARVGRDPAEIERSVLIDDERDARDVERFTEVGVNHVILRMSTPFDFKPAERLLAWRDR